MFLSSQCFFSELTDDLLSTCQPFSFYQKNGFQPLFTSEEQEFLYTGGKKGQPIKMATRLMYFDLLWMRQ